MNYKEKIQNHSKSCTVKNLLLAWDFKQNFYTVECQCGQKWNVLIRDVERDEGLDKFLSKIYRIFKENLV